MPRVKKRARRTKQVAEQEQQLLHDVTREIQSIVPCSGDWRVLWATREGVEERPVACWALVRETLVKQDGEYEQPPSQAVAPVIWAAHCLDLGDDSELFVTLLAPGESAAPFAEQGRSLYAEVGIPAERLSMLPAPAAAPTAPMGTREANGSARRKQRDL